MVVCYSIPYSKCPLTGHIVEGCKCPICQQHRKEYLINYNLEYDLFQKTCEHFWQMDIMFDWYICTHCGIMRRDNKQYAIKPSILELDEYEKSRKFYFNDSIIKHKKLNNNNINPKSKDYHEPDLSCLTNNIFTQRFHSNGMRK